MKLMQYMHLLPPYPWQTEDKFADLGLELKIWPPFLQDLNSIGLEHHEKLNAVQLSGAWQWG